MSSALVRGVEQVKPILEGIDWDFSAPFGRPGRTLFDSRKYHWYPATYIPEIPYTLIEVLTTPGAVVYDPFAGIGTTLFQAAALGRIPLGTEICRVSVNIVRSLWMLLGAAVDLPRLSLFVEQEVRGYRVREDYASKLSDTPVLVNSLRPWFTEQTFNEICFLIKLEQMVGNTVLGAALRVALSGTLKSSSAQDRGWGCVADNVKPTSEQLAKYRSAFDRFIRNIGILERDLAAVRASLGSEARKIFGAVVPEKAMVHESAINASVPSAESVDIVVTSPPYPQMTDYCLSQRLSYYWMGAEPSADLPLEIGARRKRFGGEALSDYGAEMKDIILRLYQKVKPGGIVCLVLPSFETGQENHVVRRRVVDETLAEMTSAGFSLVQNLTRMLPVRRRQHNQKWASLNKESISVYKKQ